MATGLAVSGSGVGTFFFAFITRFLLDNVQWRWTLVIEGGMLLLGVVCALTFKALPQPETVDVKQKLFYPSSPVEYATPSEYSSLLPVPDRQSKSSCACCRGFFTSIYEDIFDSNLWRRHAYLLCCACILLFCFGYHVPYTFTPERAHVAYNVSTQRSSTLLSAMGIANVGSRLLFGWVGDFGEEVRYWLGGLVLGLGGVVSVFSSLYITYPLMLLYSVLFGCFTGELVLKICDLFSPVWEGPLKYRDCFLQDYFFIVCSQQIMRQILIFGQIGQFFYQINFS